LAEIEGNLAKDKGLIAAYGATFDSKGNISNYNELFASNFNKYANADDSANWEHFKKALSQYEETLDLWFEQTEEKAELLRQILDKRLEGIQYKVDVKIALKDREIALLEHQLKRLEDPARDTAEAIANIGNQFEKVEEKVNAAKNGIEETLRTIPGITDEIIDEYMKGGDISTLAGLHIEQGQIDLLVEYSD
jgi:chromosome segregation ATPase